MVIIIKNKYILNMSAIFCALIIINSATAIPQQQGSYVLNKINYLEELKTKVENKINELSDLLSIILINKYTTGIIENLINFLIKLIEFIINLASFIATILNLGGRILYFINQLIYIIETIISIINWILDLFNPQIFTK